MSAVLPDPFITQLCTARPRLLVLARRLTRNRADAEDLVQDTMLKGITCIRSFHGGNLLGWLYTIAKNAWFSRCRSRKSHALIARCVPRDEASEDPYDAVSVGELIERAGNAISDEQSQILQQFADGMSYDEIAQAHGVALGTVKSRIARAREKIHRVIA